MVTLEKQGERFVLVLDKSIVEVSGINEYTPLDVTVRGSTLLIMPSPETITRDEIHFSLEKLYPRYGAMLQNLAK